MTNDSAIHPGGPTSFAARADAYRIDDTSSILSPGLVVYRELVERNLDRMVAIAGGVDRLRPHCKTHKMPAVIDIELKRGITRHKAATFAEAEMLAEAGVRDIVLAYNVVGPNIDRAVEFVRRWPDAVFAATADDESALRALSLAMSAADQSIQVLLDIDSGLHRTGLPIGEKAFSFYKIIAALRGVEPGGLHVYDGHNHQSLLDDRRRAVEAEWNRVADFIASLESAGLEVPRVLCGGTGSFPVYAALKNPLIECSPGTCVFHDSGYASEFPDLQFDAAAIVLTRVISRCIDGQMTLDVGTKGAASDPPAGQRLHFPDLPGAKAILQNEEHLVLRTPRANEFVPGDELLAIPTHICPTSALHKEAWVVSDGSVSDHWPVVARDRRITI